MNRFAIVYSSEDGSGQFPFYDSGGQYHIYTIRQAAVEMMSTLVQSIKNKMAGNPKMISTFYECTTVQTTFPTPEEIARWKHKLSTMEIIEVTIQKTEREGN